MNADLQKTVVLMPAYNEEANIAGVIESIRDAVPDVDILVIDDCSTDATTTEAERCGAAVLRLCANLGYGGALQAGFLYSQKRGYDITVQIDADGQHDPKCIPQLVAPIARGEADIVIGSRFLGERCYKIPALRRTAMVFFARLASAIAGQKVTDPTSGFQALSKCVVSFLATDNYPGDYPDADVIISLKRARFQLKEVPVVMFQRESGESMHSALSAPYYIAKMVLSIVAVLLRKSPQVDCRR